MDNGSTTVVLGAVVPDAVYDRSGYRPTKVLWSTAAGGNVPGASSEPKFAGAHTSGAVVVGELDVLVEVFPLP